MTASNNSSPKGHRPRTKEGLLAWELASGLGDIKGLPLYLSYARKYPEYLLRKVMGEVNEVPEDQIKKSRGALFNYLIQQYADKESDDSGD